MGISLPLEDQFIFQMKKSLWSHTYSNPLMKEIVEKTLEIENELEELIFVQNEYIEINVQEMEQVIPLDEFATFLLFIWPKSNHCWKDRF